MSTIYDRIPATPEEVEQYAGEVPAAYIHCRVWGHDPEPHNITLARDDVSKHPAAVWSAHLRCSHGCGCKWRVLVDSDGGVLKRQLDYSDAPDYVLKGKGRIDAGGRQILRRSFFDKASPIKTTKRSSRKKAR